VLVKSGADKQLETINVALGSGLVSLVIAIFLPAPAAASWPWLAGSAVVHILYFMFLAGAYRWGELSYTYPVMRGGGPMIVAVVGALALGEVLPPAETVGVAAICAGVLGFASAGMTRAPLRSPSPTPW
jgi:multidrug transporter EmrE-like cation transporter